MDAFRDALTQLRFRLQGLLSYTSWGSEQFWISLSSLILCQPSSKLGPPHLQYCQASTPHLVPSLESFALKLSFAATVSHLRLLQVGSPVPLVGFFPARFPCFASRSVLMFPWFASFPISFPLCFSCFLLVSSGQENYFICLVWREHWSISEVFWTPFHLCKGFSVVPELCFCHAFLVSQ
jgi:hypothetical protein